MTTIQERIYDNPEDETLWAALKEHVDEDGAELIDLQLRIDQGMKSKDFKAVSARQSKLLESRIANEFSDEFLEALEADEDILDLDLRYGFIDSVRVHTTYDWGGATVPELLAEVLGSELSAFLREVRIGLTGAEGEAYLEEATCLLKDRPALRELVIGDFEYPDEMEMSWVEVGDVGSVFRQCPRLTTLEVQGGGIGFSEIWAPNLRSFEIRTGGLPGAALEKVAEAEFPELQSLDIWLGTDSYGATSDISMLEPIFAGRNLPKLTGLALANSDYQDQIASELAGSEVLSRLKRVDLSMGTMSDEGAKSIVDNVAAFSHLERLDVGENYISEEMIGRLHEIFGSRLRAHGQEEESDPDDRYVTVGE